MLSVPRFLRRRRFSLKALALAAVFLFVCYNCDLFMLTSSDSVTSRTEVVTSQRQLRFESYRESEAGREGPGERGEPVHLQGEEKEMADQLMEKEAFNRIVSEKISLERSIKDSRIDG